MSPPSDLKMSIIMRMVVVLPAPLGPSRPKISPAYTSNETSSTARTGPKDLRTCEIDTVGCMLLLNRLRECRCDYNRSVWECFSPETGSSLGGLGRRNLSTVTQIADKRSGRELTRRPPTDRTLEKNRPRLSSDGGAYSPAAGRLSLPPDLDCRTTKSSTNKRLSPARLIVRSSVSMLVTSSNCSLTNHWRKICARLSFSFIASPTRSLICLVTASSQSSASCTASAADAQVALPAGTGGISSRPPASVT